VVGDIDTSKRAQLVESRRVQRLGGLGMASQRSSVLLICQGHVAHKGEKSGELPVPGGIQARDEGGPNAAAEHDMNTGSIVQGVGEQRGELDGEWRPVHLGVQPESSALPISHRAPGQVAVQREHIQHAIDVPPGHRAPLHGT
jgi:hypothetical protein